MVERTINTKGNPDSPGRLFESIHVTDTIVELAPDGSRVRPLLSVAAGSMAQFELETGQISRAVVHQSVAEIWLVLSGTGEIWRQRGQQENVVELTIGTCVSIPAGTAFQFRSLGNESLHIAAVTMPPWPGDAEVVAVPGKWI